MNTAQPPHKPDFFTLPGHAVGELKAAEGDITLASLLQAVRPNKHISLDPTCRKMSDLTRIARSYLAGLGSLH